MLILKITTRSREELVEITRIAQAQVDNAAWQDGALMLFCPHTTCGLTVNEGADPDVKADIGRFFREIAPRDHGWAHAEGNSDAHIRASLLGASLLVPVEAGKIRLGRWQSLYMYEGDGPRDRQIWLQFLTA